MSDAFEVAWRLTKGSPAPSYHQEKNRGIENLAMNPVDEAIAAYGKYFPSETGKNSGNSREAAQENVYAGRGNRGIQGAPRNWNTLTNTKLNDRGILDNTHVEGIKQDTAYGPEGGPPPSSPYFGHPSNNRIVEKVPAPDVGEEDSFGSRGYEEGMDGSAFQPNTDFSGNIPQPQKKGGMLNRFMRR
tara:strand:+ start:673 stop:1233 length:561 start_codon:yes stop_codon:yes gene_type:complete